MNVVSACYILCNDNNYKRSFVAIMRSGCVLHGGGGHCNVQLGKVRGRHNHRYYMVKVA